MRFEALLPVIMNKTAQCDGLCGSRILSRSPVSSIGYDESDIAVDQRVWKLLKDIDAKLDLVLEKLSARAEGLENAVDRRVVMDLERLETESGAAFAPGDFLETRLRLPLRHPVGIAVYGTVERCETRQDGLFWIEMRLEAMSDEVRDAVIEFAIDRQREEINKRRFASD